MKKKLLLLVSSLSLVGSLTVGALLVAPNAFSESYKLQAETKEYTISFWRIHATNVRIERPMSAYSITKFDLVGWNGSGTQPYSIENISILMMSPGTVTIGGNYICVVESVQASTFSFVLDAKLKGIKEVKDVYFSGQLNGSANYHYTGDWVTYDEETNSYKIRVVLNNQTPIKTDTLFRFTFTDFRIVYTC